MRVLLATDCWRPELGGVQNVVENLAAGLRATGDEVAILAPGRPGLPEREEHAGVPVRRVRIGRPGRRPREMLGYLRRRGPAVRRIGALVDEFRPDVVHLQFVNSGLTLPLLAVRKRRGFPFVATAQGQDVLSMTDPYLPGGLVTRRALRAADFVTACSAGLLPDVERAAGGPLPRARAVPNMVDLGEFDRAPAGPTELGRPYVLSVSTLLPKKGVDVLVRAFAALAREHPELDLVVIGEGPERAALEALAESLGMAGRVRMPGAAGRAEIAAFMRGAALFALASRVEPFGIVLAEAMAAGKPVVATRTGGIPEVVADGETGLLAPVGDPEAFAAALGRLLADREFRERAGAAGRRRAETLFSRDAVAAQYREVYRAAVAARRGSGART